MKNGKRKIMAKQAEVSGNPQKCIETPGEQVHYLQMENDYLNPHARTFGTTINETV